MRRRPDYGCLLAQVGDDERVDVTDSARTGHDGNPAGETANRGLLNHGSGL
jgi:hypothetical protein